MDNNINLLRFNCLLSNRTLSGFKNVILSLLSEFLLDKNNEEQKIGDCFNYISATKNITITFDVFNVYIGESKSFQVRKDPTDIFVKLTNDRYEEILKKIDEESLESHIERFIANKGLKKKDTESIKQILYHSIYLNIMSFDIKNIKSIITVDIEQKYESSEIRLFNQFLESTDQGKNNALFNVFLNAVEFHPSHRTVREPLNSSGSYYVVTSLAQKLLP